MRKLILEHKNNLVVASMGEWPDSCMFYQVWVGWPKLILSWPVWMGFPTC